MAGGTYDTCPHCGEQYYNENGWPSCDTPLCQQRSRVIDAFDAMNEARRTWEVEGARLGAMVPGEWKGNNLSTAGCFLSNLSSEVEVAAARVLARAYAAAELWNDGHAQESTRAARAARTDLADLLAAVTLESRTRPTVHEANQEFARKILQPRADLTVRKTDTKTPP